MQNILKIINPLIGYLLLTLVALVLTECANPVSPTGGPKDETPPEFIRAEPPMYSLNFNTSKVRIYFDEFVQLKELSQQLIISPPMDETPEIKLKGKSVAIEFKEKLKDSTTYNIFFGNAIVDLAEGNPATNFQYVFSTGDILDSLAFRGSVLDAFTLAPVKDLNVMLYLNNNDTLPYDSLPYFIKPYFNTKTSEAGTFQFNNLPGNDFKLFVLEDANSNMKFDQSTERIAFLDSLITPYFIPPPVVPDTTAKPDSLPPPPRPRADLPKPVTLYLFQERDSVQRFIKASLVKEGKMMFVFKNPTISPEIKALNIDDAADWKITEINKTQDTVYLWFKEAVPDTLTFSISDYNTVLDTIDVSTVVRTRGRKNKEKEEEPNLLTVKFGSKTELNKPLKVTFNSPIKEYDLTGSIMIESTDTLVPEFHLVDSIGLKGEFTHNWLEKIGYRFIIPDSAFTGLLGQSHDTLRHKISMRALEDYGNLFLNLAHSDSGTNYIIQLIKEDKIISEQMVTSDAELSFPYLLPGNYRIKAIIDRNNNKQWDTGHYILGIQPEAVYYFPKDITVRANWDIIEEWEL